MKKLIFLLLIGFLTSHVNAQWGVKAGVNFADFSGKDAGDTKMLAGIYGGLLYNAMINDKFSIEPQLLYSGQGAKDPDSEIKLRLHYLTLTPLARYNLQSGLFFGTGPEFDFLLSAKLKDNSTSVDVKDYYKGFSFAWAFAVGYQMKQGFGIYGRYNLGLSNILDDSDGDLKNSVIEFGIRYVMADKKK
jgi:hypothetical protein